MSDAPRAVLAELSELRHRTRADRHAFAVPLLVFGALVLVAPLLYTTGDFGEPGPLARFLGVQLGVDKANPNLIAWYWLATIVGGVAVTVWWYRRHGERTGVETGTRAAVAAVAAAAAILVLGALDPVPGKGFTALSMIAVLVIALAWLERSVLLGVVAGLFALAVGQADHAMWPGLILLAGGAAAVLVTRRQVPAGGRDV